MITMIVEDVAVVVVIALLGRFTPDAWPVMTEADALIPGFTRESFWSSVSVAS